MYKTYALFHLVVVARRGSKGPYYEQAMVRLQGKLEGSIRLLLKIPRSSDPLYFIGDDCRVCLRERVPVSRLVVVRAFVLVRVPMF